MSDPADESSASESYWQQLKRSFIGQFKNDCNLQAYEIGAEAGFATYIITRFVLKRPQSAYRYTLLALSIVPLSYWPICTIRKKRELFLKEL